MSLLLPPRPPSSSSSSSSPPARRRRRTVLVVGATGAIGRRLVAELCARGVRVLAAVRKTPLPARLLRLYGPPKVSRQKDPKDYKEDYKEDYLKDYLKDYIVTKRFYFSVLSQSFREFIHGRHSQGSIQGEGVRWRRSAVELGQTV